MSKRSLLASMLFFMPSLLHAQGPVLRQDVPSDFKAIVAVTDFGGAWPKQVTLAKSQAANAAAFAEFDNCGWSANTPVSVLGPGTYFIFAGDHQTAVPGDCDPTIAYNLLNFPSPNDLTNYVFDGATNTWTIKVRSNDGSNVVITITLQSIGGGGVDIKKVSPVAKKLSKKAGTTIKHQLGYKTFDLKNYKLK